MASPPSPGGGRRFVVVQICGLSHAVLERALAKRCMPALARLLARGALSLHRVPGGLPTSTPAFQAGVMYGGPVDIPGFEFLDREAGVYRWFPRPWDAAHVEARHARRGRGILRGGRAYGCVFGGGADDTILTFARLLRREPAVDRPCVRARLGAAVSLAATIGRLAVRSVLTVARYAGRALLALAGRRRRAPLRRILSRLLISGWMRELFTLGIIQDIRDGVPRLWVNFVDYDVAAHELGPDHRGALRALRAVDRSIRAVARAVSDQTGLGYDLYVLSDHGQVRSVPFTAVSGGVPATEAVLAAFGHSTADEPSVTAPPADAPLPFPFWPFAPAWQRSAAYLERPVRERNAVWRGGLCVVPAGPNVNVYLTHSDRHVLTEEIERRFPGALGRLARHPGVGIVLVRSDDGLLCYHHTDVVRIPPPPGPTGCPLLDRPDREIVVHSVQELMAMPSAGDVVVYGHYARGVGCVNYLGERGSHAGPSEAELYPFLAVPAGVAFDPAPVRGPRDLHPLFWRYQAQASGGPPAPEAARS